MSCHTRAGLAPVQFTAVSIRVETQIIFATKRRFVTQRDARFPGRLDCDGRADSFISLWKASLAPRAPPPTRDKQLTFGTTRSNLITAKHFAVVADALIVISEGISHLTTILWTIKVTQETSGLREGLGV